jgi:hypothetical protein
MASGLSLKQQTIHDYKKKCQKVLSKKGFEKDAITERCDCESLVVENNFSTFQLLLLAGKAAVGKPPIDKTKLSNIKQQMKNCKT